MSRMQSIPFTKSATAGLVPDEINFVVHVPISIGTDLKIIKQAAIKRALRSVRMLVSAE